MEQDFAPYEDLVPPVVLRAHGKVYTLPVIDWEQGVDLLRRIGTPGISEAQIINELLGEDLVNQLVADGVPGEFIERIGCVAFADWKFGRETAKQVWADPKAFLVMAEKIQKEMAIQQAAASTTPTPASRSSTTNRKKKATRSSGRTS